MVHCLLLADTPLTPASRRRLARDLGASLGRFHGMVDVDAAVKSPAFPGDTLSVELEARIDRRTKRGQTLVALQHVVSNQRDEVVLVFTETVVFDPPDC